MLAERAPAEHTVHALYTLGTLEVASEEFCAGTVPAQHLSR
jgi:hypothetical protein